MINVEWLEHQRRLAKQDAERGNLNIYWKGIVDELINELLRVREEEFQRILTDEQSGSE